MEGIAESDNSMSAENYNQNVCHDEIMETVESETIYKHYNW